MKVKNALFLFIVSVIAVFFAFTTICSASPNLNRPTEVKLTTKAITSGLTLTGEQVVNDQCQSTSVTISGSITGTTDDGRGSDDVTFELWDDGSLKDSATLAIPVNTTEHIRVTLSFNSLYGHSAAGVGVYVDELDFQRDPFYPEDIEGNCIDTNVLSVSKHGSGTGTVTSSPAGIDCGSDCNENYDSDSIITLTATPDSGSTFAGWSGDCDGSSPTCQVYMYSNKSVFAAFAEDDICYTRADLDNARLAGQQDCISDPSSCGIDIGGSYDQGYQDGYYAGLASCSGPPAAATLISPNASVSSPVTFRWNAVANATWYYLWVDDSTGTKIKTWYSAEDCGCDLDSGSTECSYTASGPTDLSPGGCTWWVQTWNEFGYGPWSEGMNFSVTD